MHEHSGSLSADTRLPTAQGWKVAKRLTKRDRLLTPGQDTVPIAAIERRPQQPMTRVRFTDRTELVVASSSLLRVCGKYRMRAAHRHGEPTPFHPVAVTDLAAGVVTTGDSSRWRVPMTVPADLPEIGFERLIDSYLISPAPIRRSFRR